MHTLTPSVRVVAFAPLEVYSPREQLVKPLLVTRENSTYQVLMALKSNRRKRRELNEVFVEGVAAIRHSIEAGMTIRRIVFARDKSLSSWAIDLIESFPEAQQICMSRELFDTLSDRNEPSELLITIAGAELDPDSAGRDSEVEPLFGIVVDRPSNHGNLGAIIRSANAFGVTGVLTLGHGVDPYDPAVIRASMGAVFRTRIGHIDSVNALKERIDRIRIDQPRLRVIATDSAGSASITECEDFSIPAMILIGNEAKGVSVQLKELADVFVRIPMIGAVDSLNVACAASIIMFEIHRRRREG